MENIFEADIKSEKIIKNIVERNFDNIFEGLCKKNENSIIIDYIFFKHFASLETYELITKIISKNIDDVLNNNKLFTVHINMKSLTLTEIDKHKNFIYYISDYLKNRYPNKLEKCYVYNSSYIFTQIYNIISIFIDKETMSKIEIL